MGRLCIRFPHVWHIKRLRAHLHTLIYTQLYGFGRVRGCWTALAWQRLPTHLPSVLVMQLLVNVHVCAWSTFTHRYKQTRAAYRRLSRKYTNTVIIMTHGHGFCPCTVIRTEHKMQKMHGGGVTHTLSLNCDFVKCWQFQPGLTA